MEGLNKTSIHLHLLLVCPCPGDTHDLKLDPPLCSWKAALCISATPLRSHFAVCLAVHLCGSNPVWDCDHCHQLQYWAKTMVFERNLQEIRKKKKKKESIQQHKQLYYFQIRAWPPTKCPKLPWQLTHNVLFLCVSRQHNGLPPWCCLSWHFRLPEDLESHSLLKTPLFLKPFITCRIISDVFSQSGMTSNELALTQQAIKKQLAQGNLSKLFAGPI